jgi:hypothetical protein
MSEQTESKNGNEQSGLIALKDKPGGKKDTKRPRTLSELEAENKKLSKKAKELEKINLSLTKVNETLKNDSHMSSDSNSNQIDSDDDHFNKNIDSDSQSIVSTQTNGLVKNKKFYLTNNQFNKLDNNPGSSAIFLERDNHIQFGTTNDYFTNKSSGLENNHQKVNSVYESNPNYNRKNYRDSNKQKSRSNTYEYKIRIQNVNKDKFSSP